MTISNILFQQTVQREALLKGKKSGSQPRVCLSAIFPNSARGESLSKSSRTSFVLVDFLEDGLKPEDVDKDPDKDWVVSLLVEAVDSDLMLPGPEKLASLMETELSRN
jgi:hypothetical protein